jgi:hypothetical protein
MAVLAATVAIVMGGLIMLPASVAGARASKLWVSNTAAHGADTSCSSPGYSTISSAITAATGGQTIEICSGTYVEQLNISKAVDLVGVGSPTIQLPSTPANSTTTTCDQAANASADNDGSDNQDEISICGATVGISDLTVVALWPANTCYDDEYGIFVGTNGDLVSSDLTMEGAGVPGNGCQGGVGIQIGAAWTSPEENGTATMTNTTVSQYQKNGVTVDGTDSSLTMNGAFVTGYGPDINAQNGIQVSNGAKGVIKDATISDNTCNNSTCGPNPFEDYQASGVLFFGAAPGSSLESSSLSGNDMGVYYYTESSPCPTSPEVTISKDTFSGGSDEAIVLDQGVTSISKDTFNDSNGASADGIYIFQYDGQSCAADSVATKDTISDQGVGIQVASDDAPSGDLPGEFTISHSTFLTTNTVAEENNSNNYVIEGTHNS